MLTVKHGGHTITTTEDTQEIVANGKTIIIENVEGQIFIFGRPLPDINEEDNGVAG